MADTTQPTEQAVKAVADNDVLAAVEAASKKAVIDTETKLKSDIESVKGVVDKSEKRFASMEDLITRQFEGVRADANAGDEKIQQRLDKIEDMAKTGNPTTSLQSPMEILLSQKSLTKSLEKGDLSPFRDGKTKLFDAGFSMHPRNARLTAEKTLTFPNSDGTLACGDPAFGLPDATTCIRDLVPFRQETRGFSEYFDICPEYTNNACIAEGDPKPEIDLTGDLVQHKPCKVAGKIRLTAEQLSFIAGLRPWIEMYLRRNTDHDENELLLAEIIARSTAYAGDETEILLMISDAIAQLQASGYNGTGVIVGPEGMHQIRSDAGATGDAALGSNCDPSVWCLDTCVSQNIEGLGFMVGDFRGGAIGNDFRFMGAFGTTVSLGTSGADRDSNIWTLYAERLANIDVPCELAFVEDGLSTT